MVCFHSLLPVCPVPDDFFKTAGTRQNGSEIHVVIPGVLCGQSGQKKRCDPESAEYTVFRSLWGVSSGEEMAGCDHKRVSVFTGHRAGAVFWRVRALRAG